MFAFCVTGGAILFGCCCILMMIGVQLQKRVLMIPYLIVQMLTIVLTSIVGIPIAVALFCINHPMYGISICTLLFFTSILPIYFWFVVKSAYTELSKNGKFVEKSNQIDLECG